MLALRCELDFAEVSHPDAMYLQCCRRIRQVREKTVRSCPACVHVTDLGARAPIKQLLGGTKLNNKRNDNNIKLEVRPLLNKSRRENKKRKRPELSSPIETLSKPYYMYTESPYNPI